MKKKVLVSKTPQTNKIVQFRVMTDNQERVYLTYEEAEARAKCRINEVTNEPVYIVKETREPIAIVTKE